MSAEHSQSTAQTPLTPGAAVLAWLWPGAGHISLGQRKRGLLLMAGVLFLFLSGLLIGGFDAVDRKEDRLWFFAQVCAGPIAIAADYVNQHMIKTLPEEERLQTTGLGRVNEIGTLYCALAGLMNLVVILDALHFVPRSHLHERRDGDRRSSENTP